MVLATLTEGELTGEVCCLFRVLFVSSFTNNGGDCKKTKQKTAHLWEPKMPSESGYLPPSLTLFHKQNISLKKRRRRRWRTKQSINTWLYQNTKKHNCTWIQTLFHICWRGGWTNAGWWELFLQLFCNRMSKKTELNSYLQAPGRHVLVFWMLVYHLMLASLVSKLNS